MRDMQLEVKEVKRQIEVRKRDVLLKKRMEGEITTLQIQVGGVGKQPGVQLSSQPLSVLAVY